jgi:phenylpropionate dioxygenase-like ring-hydroxylating dioxygenase large terminal subunit
MTIDGDVSVRMMSEQGNRGLDDSRLLPEWFAVGWSREVEAGGLLARRMLGRDLVLWRSSDPGGGLHCWLDLCVHRGAKLSLGIIQKQSSGKDEAGDCLVCPYHGWKYAASGSALRFLRILGLTPPAKARAQVFQVRERYGVIWVCFGADAGELPKFPIAEDAGFRVMLAGPYRFRALGPRLIENFWMWRIWGLFTRDCWAIRSGARLRIMRLEWVREGRLGERFAYGSRTRMGRARGRM